jgi:hypothetical protein
MKLDIVLTMILVVLKLVGVIAWSWWWVFSPFIFINGLLLIVLAVSPRQRKRLLCPKSRG